MLQFVTALEVEQVLTAKPYIGFYRIFVSMCLLQVRRFDECPRADGVDEHVPIAKPYGGFL
jgi:hypothetical protein